MVEMNLILARATPGAGIAILTVLFVVFLMFVAALVADAVKRGNKR